MPAAFVPECRCQDKAQQARVLRYIELLREAAGPRMEAIVRRESGLDG